MTRRFWFSCLIFLSFLAICTADYFPELQGLLDHYQYDPDCVFNYTEVNSKNIKKFPKCPTVYALLVINQNTNLTVAELKDGFKDMTMLYGGVLIENTTLTNISFFTPPAESFKYTKFIVDYYGFIVRNNPEITNVNMLWNIYIFEKDDITEAEFRVENNPKLDAKFLCDFGYLSMYSEIIVYNNLRDCACPGGVITSSTIDKYKNCESVFNGVKLYDITGSVDLSPFYNTEFIRGGIDIQNTNLKNLSFLANVGDQKMNSRDKNPLIFINLKNNSEMTRLGLEFLMEIQNPWGDIKLANFENLHPDFCLTIEEIAFFLENQMSFVNLHAKICEDNRTKIHNTVICHFESMAGLSGDCNMIIGDLIINQGDEEHIQKLENVRYLFGSLSIQNTSLVEMEKLENLKYIAQLNDTYPVIQVVGNKKMESLFLWRVENLITRNKRIAVFQDNKNDNGDANDCFVFSNPEDRPPIYRTSLNFSGGGCGKRVSIEYRYTSAAEGVICILSFILLFVIFS